MRTKKPTSYTGDDSRMDLTATLYGDSRPLPVFGIVKLMPLKLAEREARMQFYGRDRRRIKREVGKAVKSARRKLIQGRR